MSLGPCLAVGPAPPCAWNVCVSRDTPLVASDSEEDEQKAVTSEAVSTGPGQEVPLLPTSVPRCTGGLAVPSTVLAWEQAGSVGEGRPGGGVSPWGQSSRAHTGPCPPPRPAAVCCQHSRPAGSPRVRAWGAGPLTSCVPSQIRAHPNQEHRAGSSHLGGQVRGPLLGRPPCRPSPTSPSTLRKKGSWLGWGWWEPGNGCKWVGGDIERGDCTMRGREHLSDGAARTEVAGLSPGEVPLTPPSSGPWDRGAPCVPSWGSSAGSQRAHPQAPRQPGPGICGEGQPRASGAVAVGRGHTAA